MAAGPEHGAPAAGPVEHGAGAAGPAEAEEAVAEVEVGQRGDGSVGSVGGGGRGGMSRPAPAEVNQPAKNPTESRALKKRRRRSTGFIGDTTSDEPKTCVLPIFAQVQVQRRG